MIPSIDEHYEEATSSLENSKLVLFDVLMLCSTMLELVSAMLVLLSAMLVFFNLILVCFVLCDCFFMPAPGNTLNLFFRVVFSRLPHPQYKVGVHPTRAFAF